MYGYSISPLLIEESECEVVAVLLQHPAGIYRLCSTRAPPAALREFPLFGLTVPSYTELEHWAEPSPRSMSNIVLCTRRIGVGR